MLSFVLLYFLGRPFYQLAQAHERSKWGWAILGIVVFYASAIIGGAVLAIIALYGFEFDIENMSDILMSVMVIPFGILGCWLFFKSIKKSWTKSVANNSDALDSDLIS